ncbi:hypothetical protein GGI20_006251, partial [Coemansia sp. BCRC 34301]
DCDLGVEALELGEDAHPPVLQALLPNATRSLVSRPAQPPTTSKPFNPFGVTTPSKSMEIKRSDSFFNAADMHSDESTGPSTPATVAACNADSALPTAKRQSPPGEEDAAAGAPRKQAKRTTAGDSRDRVQPKLTAFAFKKGGATANDNKDEDCDMLDGALGTIAYYAQHPDDPDKRQDRRSSFMSTESQREFVVDDDPSDFSSFSSAPSIMSARMTRRSSMPAAGQRTQSLMPDHSLLEDPELQVWRDRYKWGRNYGMNFAHNDR